MNIIFRHCKWNKLHILLLLSIFVFTSCSVRSVQIKRAENRYKKGQYLASKGEVDRAIVNFEKSIRMARAVDFKEGVAHNLNELAIIHTGKGDTEKAREFLMEALDIYKELNMKPEVSKTLNNIALTYVKDKKFQEAIKWFNELIEWDKKSGNQLGVGITFYNMALIYHKHLGMKKEAKDSLMKALRIFKETGNEKYIQMIQDKIKKNH